MPRATPIEVLTAFAEAGGQLVSWRMRPFMRGVLVRVNMPSDELGEWARALVVGADLELGGNIPRYGDLLNETHRQIVFTIPVAAFEHMRTALPQPGRALPPPRQQLTE